MTTARAFRGFRFPAEVILWAVRCYLRFPVSYRDLERMLADRGVRVDHTSMYRWVQRFAPELERRVRRHLRPCRGPWHVDGTGRTIDFLLGAKRDKKAAERFLSAHDPINNLFHLRRDHVTAAEYRAARAQAFAIWVDVTGAEAVA